MVRVRVRTAQPPVRGVICVVRVRVRVRVRGTVGVGIRTAQPPVRECVVQSSG